MKHAYLIMAHNEIEILELLLKKLDHPDNSIYLHCDTKLNCNTDELRALLTDSKIHFIKRRNLQWGKYSLIKCELELLKEAVKGEYDYYHFLSGVCLPLKSNEEIDAFFEKNNGTEYISYDKTANETRNFTACFDRWYFKLNVSDHNLFQYYLRRFCNIPLSVLEKSVGLLTGKRSRKYPDLQFMKGSQFFDITHALADYITGKEREIKKIFKFTNCCDEIFLHTFAYNSPFVKNIAFRGTRYIDWRKHGKSPEVLTLAHYENMINGDYLFARKFSAEQSKELIKKLYNSEHS